MAKIDKHFSWGFNSQGYDYKDKRTNVLNSINYMLNKSNLIFEWNNTPETLPGNEIEKLLQTNGFCIVCKINGNLYRVNGGLGGETDIYNRPTQAVVSVPFLNYNATLKIDKECVVIKNDTFGMGLIPLFNKYCTLLNETEISTLMTVYNKRIQTILSASDDTTIQSAKIFLDKIIEGDTGVITDNVLFEGLKVNPVSNVKDNITDLIELMQFFKGSMLNEIGLNSNWNMKRERLSEKEIEMNSDNLYPFVDNMKKEREIAIEKINSLFDTNINVEFNSSWDYRVQPQEEHQEEEPQEEPQENEEGEKNETER